MSDEQSEDVDTTVEEACFYLNSSKMSYLWGQSRSDFYEERLYSHEERSAS